MKRKGKKQGAFPSTRWSLVEKAGRSDEGIRNRAIEQLYEEYFPVLRNYLIKSQKADEATADDILQEFITKKILEKGLFGMADRTKGKFRNYVLRSLNNFIYTDHKKKSRDPAFVDDEVLVNIHSQDESQLEIFNREWVKQVINASLDSMKLECERNSRMDLWNIFEVRFLKPVFEDEPAVPYREIARRYNLESFEQAKNLLLTAKRMFNRNLKETVSRYVGSDSEIEMEIADLRRILMDSNATFS